MSVGRLALLDGLAGTRAIEGPDGWRAVLDALAASDHCNGRTTGWKASPDWLLKPDVVADLLAGKYSRGQGPTKQRNGIWSPASASNHSGEHNEKF